MENRPPSSSQPNAPALPFKPSAIMFVSEQGKLHSLEPEDAARLLQAYLAGSQSEQQTPLQPPPSSSMQGLEAQETETTAEVRELNPSQSKNESKELQQLQAQLIQIQKQIQMEQKQLQAQQREFQQQMQQKTSELAQLTLHAKQNLQRVGSGKSSCSSTHEDNSQQLQQSKKIQNSSFDVTTESSSKDATVDTTDAKTTLKPNDCLPINDFLLEFAFKLGYSENQVQIAMSRLGGDTNQNELLNELIKLTSVGTTAESATDVNDTVLYDEDDLGENDHDYPVDNVDGGELSLVTTTTNWDESWALKSGLTTTGSSQSQNTTSNDLRPIVIDGSNVACSHGNKETFSCRGIELCVDYFRTRGHTEITVFVPRWRKEQQGRPDCPITDKHILNALEAERLLVFTPSRCIGGRRINCHDDRYILRLALETDAVIVSNDTYRDLIAENPLYRQLVQQRVLMYTFVNDRFMPPDDPLGKYGPTLSAFLRKGTTVSGTRSATNHPGKYDTPCPYEQKCTYGVKCKYQHPERAGPTANQPGGSVAERLLRQSKRQLAKVKARAFNQLKFGDGSSPTLVDSATVSDASSMTADAGLWQIQAKNKPRIHKTGSLPLNLGADETGLKSVGTGRPLNCNQRARASMNTKMGLITGAHRPLSVSNSLDLSERGSLLSSPTLSTLAAARNSPSIVGGGGPSPVNMCAMFNHQIVQKKLSEPIGPSAGRKMLTACRTFNSCDSGTDCTPSANGGSTARAWPEPGLSRASNCSSGSSGFGSSIGSTSTDTLPGNLPPAQLHNPHPKLRRQLTLNPFESRLPAHLFTTTSNPNQYHHHQNSNQHHHHHHQQQQQPPQHSHNIISTSPSADTLCDHFGQLNVDCDVLFGARSMFGNPSSTDSLNRLHQLTKGSASFSNHSPFD